MPVENTTEWKKDEPNFSKRCHYEEDWKFKPCIMHKTRSVTRFLQMEAFVILAAVTIIQDFLLAGLNIKEQIPGAGSSFTSGFGAVEESRECLGRAGSAVRLLQGAAPRAGWEKRDSRVHSTSSPLAGSRHRSTCRGNNSKCCRLGAGK